MNTRYRLIATSFAAASIALLTACGGGTAGTAEPETFEAKGELHNPTLPNSTCQSQNHRVLKTGDEVKIQANGTTVAMGEVGPGKLQPATSTKMNYCIHPFTVSGVPAGEKFYTIVIDKQGEKEVPEEELKDGSVVLVTSDLDNRPE